MLGEMAGKEAGHGMHQLPETRNQSETTSSCLLCWLPRWMLWVASAELQGLILRLRVTVTTHSPLLPHG